MCILCVDLIGSTWRSNKPPWVFRNYQTGFFFEYEKVTTAQNLPVPLICIFFFFFFFFFWPSVQTCCGLFADSLQIENYFLLSTCTSVWGEWNWFHMKKVICRLTILPDITKKYTWKAIFRGEKLYPKMYKKVSQEKKRKRKSQNLFFHWISFSFLSRPMQFKLENIYNCLEARKKWKCQFVSLDPDELFSCWVSKNSSLQSRHFPKCASHIGWWYIHTTPQPGQQQEADSLSTSAFRSRGRAHFLLGPLHTPNKIFIIPGSLMQSLRTASATFVCYFSLFTFFFLLFPFTFAFFTQKKREKLQLKDDEVKKVLLRSSRSVFHHECLLPISLLSSAFLFIFPIFNC